MTTAIRGEYPQVAGDTQEWTLLNDAHQMSCTEHKAIELMRVVWELPIAKDVMKIRYLEFRKGGRGRTNYKDWAVYLPRPGESRHMLRVGLVLHECAHLIHQWAIMKKTGTWDCSLNHGAGFTTVLDELLRGTTKWWRVKEVV